MVCQYCGAQNPEPTTICQACGKRMEGKRENQAHHHVFQGTILFLAGPLAGRSFPIIPLVTTLGRDPRNTIVVPDPAVSPFHARLVLTGSGWVIELLAPQNTLMVNQTQTRQQLIRDQDVIRLGSATVFRCGLNMGMPQYPQPPIPPVQPPPLEQTRQSQPSPPAPRPQLIRYGPLLSRRTVLIDGVALAGALLLQVAGCGSSSLSPTPGTSGPTLSTSTSVSSPTSSSPQPQPFQHVALGTLLVKYQGHDDSVLTVAWSPDSTRIASGAGGFDPTVKVWNALNGTTIYTYQHYVSLSVRSLAWSPDGKYLASGSDDGTVQVWNATNGNTLSTFRGHTNVVRSVTWSPDSQKLASGGDDGTVQVWNAADASLIYAYKGHSDRVNQVAWSPDGTRIASASNDDTVQVWGAG